MLGPRIAKTFNTRLNDTQAVAFVKVRLERVMHDMRTIELHPRPPGGMVKLGDVRRMLKSIGCSLHGDGADQIEVLVPNHVQVTAWVEVPTSGKMVRPRSKGIPVQRVLWSAASEPQTVCATA